MFRRARRLAGRPRRFMAEYRIDGITREMLRHGTACCGGTNPSCAYWTALCWQYDDALDQLRKATA